MIPAPPYVPTEPHEALRRLAPPVTHTAAAPVFLALVTMVLGPRARDAFVPLVAALCASPEPRAALALLCDLVVTWPSSGDNAPLRELAALLRRGAPVASAPLVSAREMREAAAARVASFHGDATHPLVDEIRALPLPEMAVTTGDEPPRTEPAQSLREQIGAALNDALAVQAERARQGVRRGAERLIGQIDTLRWLLALLDAHEARPVVERDAAEIAKRERDAARANVEEARGHLDAAMRSEHGMHQSDGRHVEAALAALTREAPAPAPCCTYHASGGHPDDRHGRDPVAVVAPEPTPEDRRYYIRDTRSVVGNCALWWRPNGEGYTTQLEEAGEYEETEALRIQASRDTDQAVPIDVARRASVTHVRVERLGREMDAERARMSPLPVDEIRRDAAGRCLDCGRPEADGHAPEALCALLARRSRTPHEVAVDTLSADAPAHVVAAATRCVEADRGGR